jgi:hypothetical protein
MSYVTRQGESDVRYNRFLHSTFREQKDAWILHKEGSVKCLT